MGTVASFAAEVVAACCLLRYPAARPLYLFVWYRPALVAIVIAVLLR
jgi:hypothetical protein